jgi:hypothetical protein
MENTKEISFINLTPHVVDLISEEGEKLSIQPSGQLARVFVLGEVVGHYVFEGKKFPRKKSVYGKVEGLPDEQAGTVFIVSALVRNALPERFDIVSPTDLVRNSNNQPVGAKALDGNGDSL